MKLLKAVVLPVIALVIVLASCQKDVSQNEMTPSVEVTEMALKTLPQGMEFGKLYKLDAAGHYELISDNGITELPASIPVPDNTTITPLCNYVNCSLVTSTAAYQNAVATANRICQNVSLGITCCANGIPTCMLYVIRPTNPACKYLDGR